MLLLLLWVGLAVGISFVCSLLEAVLLSVRRTALVEAKDGGSVGAGRLLHLQQHQLNDAIAAILSLNTIAHTVGAAGVGAQSAKVFESVPLAVISGVLTVLILLISEIIPKSLGAMYWKKLAPSVAALLGPITLLMTWTLFVPAARAVTAMATACAPAPFAARRAPSNSPWPCARRRGGAARLGLTSGNLG